MRQCNESIHLFVWQWRKPLVKSWLIFYFITITSSNNILKHVTSLRVKMTGAISQSAYADEMHHAFDPKILLLSVIGEWITQLDKKIFVKKKMCGRPSVSHFLKDEISTIIASKQLLPFVLKQLIYWISDKLTLLCKDKMHLTVCFVDLFMVLIVAAGNFAIAVIR